MKPLFRPGSEERPAARAALTRALTMLWQMYQTETDPDTIEKEIGVVVVAHAFAIPKRRIALAVANIRAAEKKQLMKGTPNEHYTPEKKAAGLIQSASGYFNLPGKP